MATTTARRPRRVVAGQLEPTPDNPRPNYAPGQNGTPTIRIADTIAELNIGTAEAPVSVAFPCEPGKPGGGMWAIAQLGRADGSEWMLGIGGWLPDTFPTLDAAVRAACDPRVRKVLLARQAWQHRLGELEAELRAHYAAEPDRPEQACDPGWTTRTVVPPF